MANPEGRQSTGSVQWVDKDYQRRREFVCELIPEPAGYDRMVMEQSIVESARRLAETIVAALPATDDCQDILDLLVMVVTDTVKRIDAERVVK
jgi:hypothetical protein